MTEYLEIGKIVNAQGIKGDVKVVAQTFDVKRFELLKEIKIRLNKEIKQFNIDRVWYHKQFVMLKLSGIDDRNAAYSLKDGVIIISREMALPLSEDEYYISDLYGISVVTEEGENLGEITDIISNGAHDVYTVSNNMDNSKILIPAIKQCIKEVNIKEKTMVVTLLDGLRELNKK